MKPSTSFRPWRRGDRAHDEAETQAPGGPAASRQEGTAADRPPEPVPDDPAPAPAPEAADPVAAATDPPPPTAAVTPEPAPPPAPARAPIEDTDGTRAALEAERRSLDDARDELRARREEITRIEERTLADARSAELTMADIERRSKALADRERNLEAQSEELKQAKRKQRRELEKLSSLTATEAKQMLLADVEHEARHQAGLRVLEVEAEAKRDAERRARSILAVATQRLASTHAGETTTRLVELPSDEMKGRVIGRDGRNIRALEKLTGVDIIVDETPSAITLSSFDGVRREVARITLERLIADGRIHPVQIEETFEKVSGEVAENIAREGEKAALEAGVEGLHPDLLETLGRLRYRTSYGQNVLDHLVECSHLAAMIAAELGASVPTARRGALLHDIGKAVSHESGGGHAEIGARLARRRGESEAIVHAIEAHHNETDPRTVEAVIVQTADAVSGARPGARGDALEQYVARLRDLEEIAERHYGVDRVFAMRAGREVRVIVDPGKVSDEEAAVISKEVATAVEGEVEFPGQIRITVVRETRSTSVAG